MDPSTPHKVEPEQVPKQGNAFFKSVGGLKSESEVADYQEGGVSGFTRKVIGPMKWPILLIVLGALASFAAGLIVLGILFEDCPPGAACSPANGSGDKLPRTEAPAGDAPAVIDPVTAAPPAEVQPNAGGCTCAGVDQICTLADGSQTVSYNATACGGSGGCQCRDPNRTLACPDGTYADFNPQCGVGGGGQCTCVCDAYDANQNCVAGHDSCNPQTTCLP